MAKIPINTSTFLDIKELKLFEPYRRNITMNEVGEYTIVPTNQYSPTSERFVFDFPSLDEYMIDMESIQLYVYGGFRRLNGTAVEEEDSMVPTNNLFFNQS